MQGLMTIVATLNLKTVSELNLGQDQSKGCNTCQ